MILFRMDRYSPLCPFPLELRKLLMNEAKSRLDIVEARIIARGPVDKLVERFEKLRFQDSVVSGQIACVNFDLHLYKFICHFISHIRYNLI